MKHCLLGLVLTLADQTTVQAQVFYLEAKQYSLAMVAKAKHHRLYSLLTTLHRLTVLEVQKTRIQVLVKVSEVSARLVSSHAFHSSFVDHWFPPPCLHSSTKVTQQDVHREEPRVLEDLSALITGALDSAQPGALELAKGKVLLAHFLQQISLELCFEAG